MNYGQLVSRLHERINASEQTAATVGQVRCGVNALKRAQKAHHEALADAIKNELDLTVRQRAKVLGLINSYEADVRERAEKELEKSPSREIPHSQVGRIMLTLREIIVDELKSGNQVYLAGIGSFLVKRRSGRAYTLPSGEIVNVKSTDVPRFKFSKELLEQLHADKEH